MFIVFDYWIRPDGSQLAWAPLGLRRLPTVTKMTVPFELALLLPNAGISVNF
jgi:hypothetical protein